MAKQLALRLSIYEYDSLQDLSEEDRELALSAQKACETAYAPYSNFWVGTALRLSNNQIFTGSNQENAAYPSGMCAERTALFAKGAHFPDASVLALAVAARTASDPAFRPATSCGGCRQVMSEYETKQGSPIRIIMPGPNGKFYVCNSAADLLPLQFSGKDLLG